MKSCVSAILLAGLWGLSQVQTQTPSPPTTAKPSNTTTALPKERGLIMTVFHDYGDPSAAQLRHLPMYPGYENFSGSLPGIRFNNPNIEFLSVDVDTRTRTVYLYDYYLRAIAIGTGYNSLLDLKNIEFSFMHLGVSRGSIQLAVDWLSHTVYWTDAVFRWIIAAPGQKSKIQMDYYKIIVDDHLEAPDGLAIDPLEGYLFWSDNGKHPKIERSDLMGQNRHTIITQNLQSPLSMDVDIVGKRIYWIDSLTESVLSAKYDGSDVTMITRVTDSTLLDIDSFRDVLYLTDIKNSDLLTINKTGGKMEATVINIAPETIYSVAVYGEEKQPLKDKDFCALLNCSHLCITTKLSAVCQCSDGYTYNTTTGLCDESYASLHKAIVYANTTHICLVDIRSFAHFAYEPVCIYTAIKPMTTTTPSPVAVGRRRRQVSTSNTTSSPAPTTSSTTPPTPPTSKPPSIAAPSDLIKMFGLNMANRVVYFVTADNTIYSRPIDVPIESDAKLLITRASGNISGLAFDPVNGNNLYWCESDTGNIYLVDVKDWSVRKVTPSGTASLVKPRNLLVLLEQRKLAWISSVSGSPTIQTMNFDGSDYAIIATVNGMTSLVADKEKEVFYYMVPSNSSVYQVSFDGKTGPTALHVTIDKTAYLLVHYNNYFAWVYLPAGYAYLVMTNDYSLDRQIGHGYFENQTALVDMKVLDPELQTIDKISPCAYENGNCQHICITKYTNGVMTKVCECNMGYQLADDNTSCKSSVVTDNFLIVSDWTYDMLHQIDLSTGDVHAISTPEAEFYMGVFYDRITKKVVWSQYYDTRVFSANLDGTDVQVLADLGYSYAYRFAKDETTGNLYYTSYYWQHIGLITPDLKNIWLNDNFISEDLGAIVVHPGIGWMFYTVNDYPDSYVVRSDMDGTINKKIITTKGYVDGLAIDYRNDRLYWSDATYDTIQGCDFDGRNCMTIVNISSLQAEEIRDLAINGDQLYYSAYKKDHVVRVSLKPPYDREEVGHSSGGFGKLDTISLYNSANTNTQPVGGACRDRNGLGDCSTVCIPTSQGRTCMCEDGVDLRPDDRTCEDIHQCTDVIVQQGTNKEDVKITFSSACLRHYGDQCNYFCPANYVPVNKTNTMLTCTSVGWDREPLKLCEEGTSTVRCPTSIENGVLSSSCKYQVGEICDYTCNTGYIKTEDSTFCTQDGTYHKDTADFCALYTCPDTIMHGSLNNCPRTLGSTCTVTCDKYYTLSTDSAAIKCVVGGWNTNTATLCKASQCTDSSLMNGQVTGSCSRGPGDVCQYICNSGYYNSTAMVVCNSDMSWHPPDACGLNMCPIAISNGRVSGDCSRKPKSVCGYACNTGFNSSHIVSSISCLISGQWNQTDNLCIGGGGSASSLTTGPEGISKGGVVAGIIILVIIVIALAVAIVYLVRRGISRSHAATYGNATFINGGSVEIENPGYSSGPAAGSGHKDEHPYSSVDPSQMQPVSFAEGYATADTGIVNPMYNREPLSDVAQVQINQDKEVLTYDSWLREQEKMGKT